MSGSAPFGFWLRIALVGPLALLVAGCGGGFQDLQQYVNEVKSRKQGEMEPLPEIKEVETYAYVAGDRRDPFTPVEERAMEVLSAENGMTPDLNRRKEELEEYALDSLRMVGTIEQQNTTWALIKTADGSIHRIKPGNYIGQNFGRVVRVTETEVELTELIPDGKGGYRERQASLALAE